MTKSEHTVFFRRLAELALTLWATVVFQGLVLGSFLLFLRFLIAPTLTKQFGDLISLNIPHWLFFTTGIAINVAITALRGKPLLKDTNREQLEAIDYFVQKLPHIEKMQLYRRLAYKLVDEFKLDKNLRADILKHIEPTQNKDKEPNIEMQPTTNAE